MSLAQRAEAEAMRRHARGELYELTKSRITTFIEGATWGAMQQLDLDEIRDRIKLAIQTAKDTDGETLYVIPPGAAGMYADAITRALTLEPYPNQPQEPS